MGSPRTFEHLFGVRYETNGHYLGSLPDLIGHTGMQYHACTSFVSAQGEQVDFQELSKFTFLSNRACWPLEVIAILQTISRLLNCIYRQPISGQMEENYQGNNKPHEISTWSSITFPSPAKFPRRQAGSRAALLNGQVVVTGGHAGTTSIGRYTDEVPCFSLIWCHYPGKLISAILSRCWFISRCISTT